MKPTLFITRNLTPDGAFMKALSPFYQIVGRSLIKITPIPFQDLPTVDWYFFYSKTGVRIFLEHIDWSSSNSHAHLKWGAMGPATAQCIRSFNIEPDFVGTGNPTNVVTDFLAVARGLRVLFLRALNSMKSVQRVLADQIIVHDLPIYRNEPMVEIGLPVADTLVFTSPMNVRAYLNYQVVLPSQTVIAIGRTTRNALEKQGITEVLTPTHPTEESIIETLIALKK